MMATDACGATPLGFDDLPPEVLDRITLLLRLRDLASLNATARLFHAAPPGGCSPVELALRERARARGHESALPASLPEGVRTWAGELLVRERVLELACAHASPAAAGDGFSAFVDADGGLHTCGEEKAEDEDGEPTYRAHVASDHSGMPAVRVPTHVASLSAVSVCSVAAGYNYLLALSEAGDVYGCGNNDEGQLGLGDTEDRHSFALAELPASEPVVAISAGHCHSLALSAAGCAYSWGHNYYGQLGQGDRDDRWEPALIEALDGVRVGGMAAGAEHTLLISTTGAVYSCGRGQFGCPGHGDGQAQRTPRRVEALAGVRAVHVSAGRGHSLVVDAEGGVLSFGSGRHMKLGHGDQQDQHAPRRVEALAGVRAVRACAGVHTSAVLGADGNVHTFGDNGDGQLGLGHGESAEDAADGDAAFAAAHDLPPQEYHSLLESVQRRRAVEFSANAPSKVGALAHARVVRCAMGRSHALFVSSEGSVYACGKESAALGLGMGTPAPPARVRVIDTPECVETAWSARLLASPSGAPGG